MKEKILLSEMISARFCHEMAGPLGAVNSGVEFLDSDDEEMKRRAYELVKDSAEQSVNRLQFYRQVYGTAPKHGEADLARLKELSLNYFSKTKNRLHWNIDTTKINEVQISSVIGKTILNLEILAAQILIMGGDIYLNCDVDNNSLKIEIEACGEVVKLTKEVEAILNGMVPIEEIQIKDIHSYYTKTLIDEAQVKLSWEIKDKSIKFLLNCM